MKFIPLHTKNTAIVYKSSLCSSATILVLVFIVLSVMIPVLLVSLLSPYSGIIESRIVYEQPRVQYKFQYLFIASTSSNESGVDDLIGCSTFASFNERMQPYGDHCDTVKYWSTDLDHDSQMDRTHFQLNLDGVKGGLKSFALVMLYDVQLKHKCNLSPPAVLIYNSDHLNGEITSGSILLKAELQLKQNIEFTCPFPGRKIKTNFRHVVLNTNASADSVDMEQFQIESLLEQLKANPAYFHMNVLERYTRRDRATKGLRIQIDLDLPQVPARYHLSVWQNLGQFWLYFASFFGVSFYVMNKVKDFLFGRHIIRSWEIIPWKKLY